MNPKDFHREDCEGKEKDLNRMRRYVNYKPQLLRNGYFTNKVIKHMIAKNHFECFEDFVTYENTRLNSTDMWYAVEAKSIKFLELLTEFEIEDLDMDKCLRIASHVLDDSRNFKFKSEKMKLLIDYGFTVDHPAEPIEDREMTIPIFCYMAPIVHAVLYPKVFKLLLFKGVRQDSRGLDDVDVDTKECFSLIHHISAQSFGYNVENEIQVLDMLHKLGGNFHEKNRNGLSAIEIRQSEYVWAKEHRQRVIHGIAVSCSSIDDDIYDNYEYYDENTDSDSDNDDFPDAALFKYGPIVKQEKFDVITKKIQELMETPLSLMCHCRISLMKLFGSNYMEKTELLRKQLPDKIVLFLQGSDLPANEA